MDLGDRSLEVSPEVQKFIQDSDYFIGNFEATITDAKPRGMDQVHHEQVLSVLKELYPPSKTFLSISNNHSGDFGQEIFEDSVNKIHKAGFNTFGKVESPSIDINPDIRLTTASMWSNRQCDFIAKLEDIDNKQSKVGAFNILYPHWGYDLELYPRLATIDLAKKYLVDFDAIIGHHSHAPQPITSIRINEESPTKLCAYSLGDFCFGKLLTKHFYNFNYGILLKTKIGKINEDQLAIGNIEWSFTECIQKDPETLLVEMKETNPYYQDIN
jgi:poly-gamma-glutamate capsule biosynthesis protein CapA/YwtB (metallophosphatase superfamily)